MRTREEIEDGKTKARMDGLGNVYHEGKTIEELQLEVLLDIRDLLSKHTCKPDSFGLCYFCHKNMLT